MKQKTDTQVHEWEDQSDIQLLGLLGSNPVILTQTNDDAFIKIYNVKSGKTLSKKLKESPSDWEMKSGEGHGPLVVKDKIIYAIGGVINVIQFKAGKASELAIKVSDEEYASFAVHLEGNDLFIFHDNGLLCLDLSQSDKKKLIKWKAPIALSGDYKVMDDRVVLVGTVQKKGAGSGNPLDSVQGIEQVPGIKEDYAQFNDVGSSMNIKLVLASLDRATGKPQWQVGGIGGLLAVSEERIAMVLDTKITSITGMFMKEGEGELVVRQYDISNGKLLYERVNDHQSFSDPIISGDKLYGLSGSKLVCIELR